MTERRYKHSFAELCDRLNIVIQKIAFAETEEMKLGFIQERDDIAHDIDLFIKEGVIINAEMLIKVCSLQFINYAIWQNESGGRGDGEAKNYELSHGLNANRADAKKKIQQLAGGRIDYKLNYIKGAWDLRL